MQPTPGADGASSVRTAELEAPSVLGVDEHHWLDYPDGGCADVDVREAATGSRRSSTRSARTRSITFGPDGFTGHPDHQAVSALDRPRPGAVRRAGPALHAVAREGCRRPRSSDEEFGVFELGRPRVCADDELACCSSSRAPRWTARSTALLRQESQTGGLVDAVGLDRFRAWVASESVRRSLNP